ncbi:TPA: hypothetical protein HA265_03715, partial [Candidatus Woesearchaeota archaeon]|nr:hypothetical protein [Candidatus Woesearchaeota archaeon]
MFFVLCSSFALADANDVCSGASTMTVGTSNHGLINPQGDIDWGKWYVSSPGRLTVTLDVPSSKDYSLAVYSSCSQRVCLSGRGTGLDETCVIDVQPGYYYTKVWGDYNQWSDYYRHYIATRLEVAPEPDRYDFVVGSIQPTISNPTTEDSFNINYDVRNNGPDDFYGSFGTTLYIDGVNKGTITRSGSFNSGTTQSFTKYGVQLSAGSHSIRVVADSSNQADETNEGNNEKTIYISVSAPAPPQYDLVVERITPSIQFPTAGVPFNIDYVVRNNGQDRYTGSFRTTMYIDGNIDSSVPRTDISAGGTEMFTKYNVPLTEGRHLIRIITDSSNEVSETNEYNNERTLYIDVVAPELPEYDLILESITPSIQFPIAGEPFDIDFIVKNTGSDGYPGSFTTQLYIDDVLKATSPRTDISSGGTEAFTRRDVVLTEGRHLARVLTDTGD